MQIFYEKMLNKTMNDSFSNYEIWLHNFCFKLLLPTVLGAVMFIGISGNNSTYL